MGPPPPGESATNLRGNADGPYTGERLGKLPPNPLHLCFDILID